MAEQPTIIPIGGTVYLDPFAQITGIRFPRKVAGGDFYYVDEVSGNQSFVVFKIGTAAPRNYTDSTPAAVTGSGMMIRTIDKLFGLYRNNAGQYRGLSNGSFSDFGSPSLSSAYSILNGLIATASRLGIMAREGAGFDRVLSDGNTQAVLEASSNLAQFRAVAADNEMFMAVQEGNDATVIRLNLDSSTHTVLYTHSTAFKSIEGMLNSQIKKGPVANLLNDLAFVVSREDDGVLLPGLDIYVNDAVEKAVDAPTGGTVELINIQPFDNGFGYAYLETPSTGNPFIHVGTLTWNGSAYVDSEQSFEVDINDGGQVRNTAMAVTGDGVAYAWVSHTYYDLDANERYRAAAYSSAGVEQQYADTDTFSFNFAFNCIDAIGLADRVIFFIDNNSLDSGNGVNSFGNLALVDSTDMTAASFSAGGTNTLNPTNMDSSVAYEPGYLRATRDRAFVVVLHTGTLKYRLLGSDATDVTLDDQLPAFTSRFYNGMVPKSDHVYAIFSTVQSGPSNHIHHVSDAAEAFEYTGDEQVTVIPRAQIQGMQEIEAWGAT